MNYMEITNPNTDQIEKVIAWDINPREVITKFSNKEYTSVKDLSWELLGDTESTKLMVNEQYGDTTQSNFNLHILENALDWVLGTRVIKFIQSAVKEGKIPKPFKVATNRKGKVFIIGATGRVY